MCVLFLTKRRETREEFICMYAGTLVYVHVYNSEFVCMCLFFYANVNLVIRFFVFAAAAAEVTVHEFYIPLG